MRKRYFTKGPEFGNIYPYQRGDNEMYQVIDHTAEKSRYFDSTQVLGEVSEISEEAFAEFMESCKAKGPRFNGYVLVDFEIDEENDAADAVVMVGGAFHQMAIEAA